MRKDTKRAKITEIEIKRNKQISKKRYIAAPGGIIMGILSSVVGFDYKQKELSDNERSIPLGKKQYFGLSHLHDGAYKARFTTIIKNTWDAVCRQTLPDGMSNYSIGVAFNIFRGSRLLAKGSTKGEVCPKVINGHIIDDYRAINR